MPDPNKPNGQARTEPDDLRRLEQRVRELADENERLRQELAQAIEKREVYRAIAVAHSLEEWSKITEEDLQTASGFRIEEIIAELERSPEGRP
jgi:hypothetical protein